MKFTDTTVDYVRQLRPYAIRTSTGTHDIFVNQIFQDSCSQDFITSLEDYSRATYNEDLHYLNFFKFVRPRSSDLRFSQKVAFSTHIATAKQHVLQKLDFLRNVKAIPHNQLDLVEYVSSSAAGYGYIGKKKDNYLLARRNATRALHGFAKYKTNYRFVPDKAFARSHLTSIAMLHLKYDTYGVEPFTTCLSKAFSVNRSLKPLCTPAHASRHPRPQSINHNLVLFRFLKFRL